MMLRYLPCLFFTFLACNNSYAQEEIPLKDYKPNIIVNRNIQLSLGFIPRNAKWQGLYCDHKSCEIKNVKLKIGKNFVDYLYEEKVPLDTIKVKGEPIALFPFEKFKTGKYSLFYKLESNNAFDSTYPSNKQYYDLENEKKWSMPWSNQPLTLFWTKENRSDIERNDYRNYQITDGKKNQSLFKIDGLSKYEGKTTPIIHLVSDLDNDNKLDMILEIPDDNCGFDYRLYLSSEAKGDEILHESLRFTGTQDACGC